MRTATDLRDATVSAAVAELGYTSGSYTNSKFGKASTWVTPWLWGTEWQGLWCNRFLSRSIDKAMGVEAGKAAVGRQDGTPLPVGFAATWLQREWFMANNRHVGFGNSQPGDYYLFKLPGRQTNPTNHVGMFVKWHTPGKVAITIEGNLPHPVTRTTASIGAHYHYRDIKYVVGVYRPDWQAAADVWNANNPAAPEPTPEPVQPDLTEAEVEEIMKELRRQAKQLDTIEKFTRQAVNRAYYQGPNKVNAYTARQARLLAALIEGDNTAAARIDALATEAQAAADVDPED